MQGFTLQANPQRQQGLFRRCCTMQCIRLHLHGAEKHGLHIGHASIRRMPFALWPRILALAHGVDLPDLLEPLRCLALHMDHLDNIHVPRTGLLRCALETAEGLLWPARGLRRGFCVVLGFLLVSAWRGSQGGVGQAQLLELCSGNGHSKPKILFHDVSRHRKLGGNDAQQQILQDSLPEREGEQEVEESEELIVLAVDLVGGDVEPAVSGEDRERCQEAHGQGLETQAELATLNVILVEDLKAR
mmetsp:Transcript_17723/g.42112  ORF Transcript_17723/g.42112 Transcript_17723/m.42112 type:complete len:245 (-) Transcript_17723:1664-2398(-)